MPTATADKMANADTPGTAPRSLVVRENIALFMAAEAGDKQLVQKLLAKGANVNQVDPVRAPSAAAAGGGAVAGVCGRLGWAS